MTAFVVREEVLKVFSALENGSCRALVMEAQAGQGKSTVLEQFRQRAGLPLAVLTCTTQDTRPLHFAQSLARAATQLLPASFSVDFRLHETQVAESIQAASLVEQIVDALNRGQDMTLALDDLHLLHDNAPCLELLRTLFEKTQRLRLVAASRYPVLCNGRSLFDTAARLEISNALLAFSRKEILQLYAGNGAQLDAGRIEALFGLTEGWVTGLQLLRNALQPGLPVESLAGREAIAPYFLNLLKSEGLYHPELVLAAHLDTLPVVLLEEFAPSALAILRTLEQRKQFVRFLRETENPTLFMHHLMRDALLEAAQGDMDRAALRTWLVSAGKWLLDNGDMDRGLDLLVMSKDWDTLATIMLQSAQDLMEQGAHATVERTLRAMPEEILQQHAWLMYSLGACLIITDPAKAIGPLEQSILLFRQQSDEYGELLASCDAIAHGIFVSGNTLKGRKLARRCIHLYMQVHAALSQKQLVMASAMILCVFAYHRSDYNFETIVIGKILPHLSEARRIVRPQILFFTLFFEAIFGNCNKSFALISDHCNHLSHNRSVFYDLCFETTHINLLSYAGFPASYEYVQSSMNARYGNTEDADYLLFFTSIWDADFMVSCGNHDGNCKACVKILDLMPSELDHVESQILHYHAISIAAQGDNSTARTTALRSLRMRAKCGGLQFHYMNRIMIGTTFYLCNDLTTAKRIFQKNLKMVRGCYLDREAACHAYLCLIHRRLDDMETAMHHLEAFFAAMDHYGSNYFYGWERDSMLELLSLAVQENVHPARARQLALLRHGVDILDNGMVLPHLLVDDIGETGLHFPHEKRVLRYADITKKPRLLLLQLMGYKDMAVERETIMEEMWPDKDLKKQEANLARNKSALERVLSETIAPDKGDHYCLRSNTHFSLCHCTTVSDRLMQILKLADREYSRNNDLLAFAHMADAHALIRLVNPDRVQLENCTAYGRIAPLLEKLVPRWLRYHETFRHHAAAHDILDLYLSLMPSSLKLARAKYDSCTRTNQGVQASEAFETYVQAHREQGVSGQQLREVEARFWG